MTEPIRVVGALGLLCLFVTAIGVGTLAFPHQADVETHVRGNTEFLAFCEDADYAVTYEIEGMHIADPDCYHEKAQAAEAAREHQSELDRMLNPTLTERLWILALPLVGFIGGIAAVGVMNRDRDIHLTPSGTVTRQTIARIAAATFVVYGLMIFGTGIAAVTMELSPEYGGFFDRFSGIALYTAIHAWLPALLVGVIIELVYRGGEADD